jgi:hypothetical protein
VERASSVRDTYRDCAEIAHDSVDWLAGLVADQDLDGQLDQAMRDQEQRELQRSAGYKGKVSDFSWVAAIDDAVEDDLGDRNVIAAKKKNKPPASEKAVETARDAMAAGLIATGPGAADARESDDPELNSRLWSVYRPLVQRAIEIHDIGTGKDASPPAVASVSPTVTASSLPSTSALAAPASKPTKLTAPESSPRTQLMKAAEEYKRSLEGETMGESMFTFNGMVSLNSNTEGAAPGAPVPSDPLAMLFTLPRSYRALGAVGSQAEIDSFFEVFKSAKAQTDELLVAGRKVLMVPLHPLMYNQKGQPDYFRRAPHPAILFFLQPEDARKKKA